MSLDSQIDADEVPNSSECVVVAQIGVGYWGPNLLRNLVANPRCKVSHVVDLSETRRAFVKELYPWIRTELDVSGVLADPSVDAIVIATPPATHFELSMAALAAGKHVFVEKPMATTIREVERVAERANETGLLAMVGHTFLYNPAVRCLKQLVDEGTLGDVRYIYSRRLNLGRIRSDVDALWNLAPHDVSIIQYLLGEPSPLHVTKHGVDYVQEGVDDVVFMTAVYPNKVLASIHVSWLDPQKVREMIVVGSQRMVVYDDISENKITIYDKGIDRMAVLGENMDFDRPLESQFKHRSGDVLIPKIDWVEPIRAEMEHFMECILDRVPCLSGPAHALSVVRTLAMTDRRA